MAACPLGLLLCKTLPGNRRVHDQPDEGHGVRRKRHWSESAPNENRRLKRMYADLSMQADLLKEALGKK